MLHYRLALSAIALTLAACNEDVEAPEKAPAIEAGNTVDLPIDEAEPVNLATAPAADETKAPAQAAPWSSSGYRLIGTEPFWGGTAGADRIVYSTPENQDGEEIEVNARLENDREIYSGSLRGKPFVLTLTAGPCSDGMSDNVHRFTATLQVDSETRRGCANPRT
jgi:uncharacterized membrane protein